jgi:hypothetical protein
LEFGPLLLKETNVEKPAWRINTELLKKKKPFNLVGDDVSASTDI